MNTLLLVLVLTLFFIPVYAETESSIPDWIKTNAEFWTTGQITDKEFLSAIQYLINNNILQVKQESSKITPENFANYKILSQNEIQRLEKNNELLNLQLNVIKKENQELESSLIKSENSMTSINDYGDFKLSFMLTKNYSYEYEFLNEILPNEIDYLNQIIKLPYDISIIVDECGVPNAFYSSESRSILFCYELVTEFYDVFSNEENFDDDGVSNDSISDGINSNVIEALYHEIGHAMLDVWEIPFTGLEENVSDQFAVYLMWGIYEIESINDMLYDVSTYYWIKGDTTFELEQSDVHSLDRQRFYNLQCYAYGFDKNSNQYLISDGWLPLSRSHSCEKEFQSLTFGFSNIFSPYLK